MLRVVVVDDEKLVRRGFISMFDWPLFGMEIVGEAADGRAALELLGRTEADLLFTDITMPGMSGFELIKTVRRQYPTIRSVILTCHHEFDFIQEALRLGAIDYIVKTLLEADNADEVMSRIVERIGWENMNRPALAVEDMSQALPEDSALLLIPRTDDIPDTELLRLPVVAKSRLIRLGRFRLVPLIVPASAEELSKELTSASTDRIRAYLLSGIQGEPLQKLHETLQAGTTLYQFYSESEQDRSRLPYETLKSYAHTSTAMADEWLEAGRDLRWTLYSRDFDEFIQGVVLRRTPPGKLLEFAEELCRNWKGCLLDSRDGERLEKDARHNATWRDWEGWLRRFSDCARNRMLDLSLSREVMACLIRAVRYMTNNAGSKITQNDVAAHICMSRSYFSQCFARFAGQPFGELLRQIRIERAKHLLVSTNAPVYEIAASAGFEDDKYFSKLFRERVGLLPTEYRSVRDDFRPTQ